ncbi:MAG: protein translocase subunit SecD [Clostridia bacterium]|nr:protein translocase subunit SecD [Clostridia bacterium]
MGKNIAKLLVVILLIAAVVYGAFFDVTLFGYTKYGALDAEHGVRRGLDLTGGSVIVYEADAESASPEDMSKVESIMRKRLDGLGYTEATISLQGEKRVRIEIPSITDPEEAVEKLGATAQLTFTDADGVPVMTGADIKSAKKLYDAVDETGIMQNYVQLELNPEGVQKFADATAKAASRAAEGKNFIAIVLDDQLVSSPTVKEQINSDTAVITGDFTAEEAVELANLISSGQLPFSLKNVELRSVGPTLGEQALETSLLAAAIGIAIILLFMIVVYRIPGFAASLALCGYVGVLALIMGVLHVNLTLPGFAGIILSVGMAVDANVIIFERIKEELNNGKTIRAAVAAGFKRAFTAIIDSNVTTLIAAVVLFVYGTGTIKGFAITLGLGIIVSMFTAIFVTKFILTQLAGIFGKNNKLYGGR